MAEFLGVDLYLDQVLYSFPLEPIVDSTFQKFNHRWYLEFLYHPKIVALVVSNPFPVFKA